MKINYKEVTIITVCPFCGHTNEIAVNEVDYWDWQDGALVWDAFPYLTADEREMLITGICPTCWEDNFGEDEDFDDEIAEGFREDLETGFNPHLGGYDFDC